MAESARPSGRKRRRPWIQLAVLTVITHSVASAAQLTSSSSSGSWSSADELRIESAIVTSTLPVPSPTAETALRTTPFSTAHVVRPNVPAPVQTTPAPSWTAVPTSSSPASTKTTSIPEKIDDNGAASKASSDSSGATSGSSDAGVPGDGSYGSSLPPDDSSGNTLLPPKPGTPLPRPPGGRPMPSPVPFPPDPPGLLPAPLPPWSPEPTLETLPPKPTSPSLTSAPTTPLPGPGIMPKPVVLRPTKAPTTPPASARPPPPPPPQGGIPISDDDDIESPPPPSYLPPPLQPPSRTASSPTSSTPSSNPIGGDTASGSDDSDETGPPPPSRSLPPLRASQEPTPTPEGRTSATPESQDPYAQESPRPPMLTQAPKTSSPQPESSRRYERGDDVVKIEVVSSGSGSTLTSPRRIVITPSKAPAVVIGGNDDSVLTNSGASSHRGESSDVYTFLRYVTSIAALLSIFWLAGCQVAATMSRPAHMFIGPNQWEFALFSSYAQTIGSFSQLVITPNIPRFVLRFADAYSWTVFLPLHGSDSGISTSGTTEGRRLDRVVLDGIVGFADRVGVQESDILSKTTIGFVVVMAALLTVLVAFYFIPKCMSVPKSIEDTDSRAPTGTTVAADGLSTGTQENELDEHDANTYLPMLFVGGLVVSVWFFSLYPLTLFSSYEIATEARTSIDGSSITIAILVLACFCITGLLFAVAMIWRLRSDSALSSTRHLALWGSLYAGTRPSCRLFFVVFALNQMLRAVIVGSVVDDAAQLISLIAIDMVVLVTVCLLRPFESSPLLTPFVCVVYGLRILNTSLGFAFSRSSTGYPARRAVGIAFIAINSAVVLLWFARHFGMACHIVRRAIAARRRRHPPPTRSPMEDAAYVSIDQRDEEVERIYRQFANRRDSW